MSHDSIFKKTNNLNLRKFELKLVLVENSNGIVECVVYHIKGNKKHLYS